MWRTRRQSKFRRCFEVLWQEKFCKSILKKKSLNWKLRYVRSKERKLFCLVIRRIVFTIAPWKISLISFLIKRNPKKKVLCLGILKALIIFMNLQSEKIRMKLITLFLFKSQNRSKKCLKKIENNHTQKKEKPQDGLSMTHSK